MYVLQHISSGNNTMYILQFYILARELMLYVLALELRPYWHIYISLGANVKAFYKPANVTGCWIFLQVIFKNCFKSNLTHGKLKCAADNNILD